jgi:cobalt-precorrin-5B (C1)-methyltransferase
MSISPPRSGYTLPVFACASAIASLQHLHGENELNSVTFNLLEPPEAVTIAIEQVARLNPDAALAITRSEPGDNLDLTRNTPIWALVERKTGNQEIEIQGGEGIGIGPASPARKPQTPVTAPRKPQSDDYPSRRQKTGHKDF